jgi:hypothetical protein
MLSSILPATSGNRTGDVPAAHSQFVPTPTAGWLRAIYGFDPAMLLAPGAGPPIYFGVVNTLTRPARFERGRRDCVGAVEFSSSLDPSHRI